MSESKKSFTVSDRRHFTPEGRPRDDAGDAASGEASPAAVPPSAGEAPPPGAPADFAHFLLGLGAQAGMLLSGKGEAEGAQQGEALEGARSVISILEMLKDKTEGRRTPSEDALLDDLLFQLRLAYVEATRARGQ
jgi:hypothetical protein